MNPPENPITYTKTEINRMSTADLQKLAAEQGIENAQTTQSDAYTDAELIEKGSPGLKFSSSLHPTKRNSAFLQIAINVKAW